MTIYRSDHYSMKFSKSIQRQLVEVQKDFMPEDTEAGQIQGFLEHYTGSMVCSKQLFKEALGHTYEEPKRWQLHNCLACHSMEVAYGKKQKSEE